MSVTNSPRTVKIGHSRESPRGRGDWDPETEPHLPISAVPNGHLAVWDGRDGADMLHLAVPNLSPCAVSLSLFKNFPRRVSLVLALEREEMLGFCISLGERKGLSSSLDEGEAAIEPLGDKRGDI